jgi:hypothetical protein
VFIRDQIRVWRRSGRGVGCSFVMQVVALVVVLAVVVTATRRLFAWSELELSLASLQNELTTARPRTTPSAIVGCSCSDFRKYSPSLTAIEYHSRKQYYTRRDAEK